LGSFDDGKFSKELCPIVSVITYSWPPKVRSLTLHLTRKDPGDLTEALARTLKEVERLIIDSITICGLGYVNPSLFDVPVIVVSKYIPNIRKAYRATREIYGSRDFEMIAEGYLRKVKCVKLRDGKRCIAPYKLSFEEALKIVEERTLIAPMPEEVRMVHEIASAIGRWLNRA